MGVSSTSLGSVAPAASSSVVAVAPSGAHPQTEWATPAWKAVAPVAIAILLALLPVPSGLAPHAWYYFSIFVGIIVGLILEPLPGAAISVIGITTVTVLARFVLFSPQELSQSGFRPASAALAWGLGSAMRGSGNFARGLTDSTTSRSDPLARIAGHGQERPRH